MPEIILYLMVFTTAYFGVRRFRRWSIEKNLLDIPNERSSHSQPTPRGGGLIIVLVSLSAYVVFCKITNHQISAGYLGGAFLIALISWLDDVFTVSFVWRILIHSLAAILVIASAGFFNSIQIPFLGDVELRFGGAVLAFIWIIGLTNAFNFMDGIDGLAGIQAVTAGIGWMLFGKFWGFGEASILGGILAFASLGFLMHNWSPARIFMGDVGSAFLGFSFAVLPLLAKNSRAVNTDIVSFLPLIAAALVWLFLFDTVSTFLQRVFKRKKVWQAHREHIYQKLVISGCSHVSVSGLYGMAAVLTLPVLFYAVGQTEKHPGGLFFFLVLQTFVVLFVLYFSKRKSNIEQTRVRED